MQELLDQVYLHPFKDIQVFMSLWAAFGVIIFCWGFLGYFLAHGHAEHQDHARVQIVWGTMLTGAAIIVWEAIHWISSFFI